MKCIVYQNVTEWSMLSTKDYRLNQIRIDNYNRPIHDAIPHGDVLQCEGVQVKVLVCVSVFVYVEFGYVLRTTDYGYRQHEREHENLVEQPGTLGLKLTGATPAGAHGHSAHPWPHCAVHDRSYPTTDITDYAHFSPRYRDYRILLCIVLWLYVSYVH